MAGPMRVVAVGPWDRPGWTQPLAEAGYDVIEGRSIEHFPGQPYSQAEMIELCRDADAVLVSSRDQMTRPIIEACPKVRLIAKATIGVEVIDLDAATEHGILVCNSPALENLIGVAEGAVAQILALLKRVRINERLLRAGQWRADDRLGELLWGKTVGIVGLGRIGSNVARRLQTWDVRLLAADPYVEPGHAVSVGARLVPIDELMAESDAITVHVNLTAETRGLISDARLRAMKPTAYLVNSSRGPVVDEAALCRAISTGWIAGAALDVFEQEPLKAGNPILDLDPDRVILTPHCIGASQAMRETGTQMSVDNMLRALRGELPRNIVNPEAISAWKARDDLDPGSIRAHVEAWHLRRLETAALRDREGHRQPGDAHPGGHEPQSGCWSERARQAGLGSGSGSWSSGVPSIVIRGIQSRKRGIHQFHSPSRRMLAGSSRLRMMVASTSTATARPSPSCRMITSWSVTNTAKTATMIAAALVIVPAVIEIPRSTAADGSSPADRASWILVRIKTW